MAAFSVGSASRKRSRRLPRAVMRARMSSSVSRRLGLRGVWVASRASAAARSALTWRVHSVGSGVEGGLVAGEAGVAVGNGSPGVLGWRGGLGGGGCGLGCLHLGDGAGEPAGREDDSEPSVDGGQDVGFAEVDVGRVADVAGEGVFLRVPAPVVGSTVVVLALSERHRW